MKTTSLSVAYKKHIYNQTHPLKSEDTSAFDPIELAGAKEGSSPWSETTSNAIQTTTHMDDSEFQVLNLKKKDFHMKLVSLYSPNGKALSLNALPAVEDHYLVFGDFNSHSQSWGHDHIDKRGEEVENFLQRVPVVRRTR